MWKVPENLDDEEAAAMGGIAPRASPLSFFRADGD